MPTWQPWSNKSLERIQRSKDIVQISRFLQSENGIPQVRYACRQLPREAVRLGSTNVVARLHPSTISLQTGSLTVHGGDVFTVSLGVRANTLAVTPGRP